MTTPTDRDREVARNIWHAADRKGIDAAAAIVAEIEASTIARLVEQAGVSAEHLALILCVPETCIPDIEQALAAAVAKGDAFQARVGQWMHDCFPAKVCADRLERRDRLVEEALELAQTLPDFTADRAHALVDYVFGRPAGVTEQEVGGVSVTLAALCEAEGIDQRHWAEAELSRISSPETIAKIRAKQAAKPTGSALPIAITTGAHHAE